MRYYYGFHLIEILITLSIIGILTAISLPPYSRHMITLRRLEAATMLSRLAIALERYQLEQHSYKNATLEKLSIPEFVANNNYKLNISEANDFDYQISATPLGKQATADLSCGKLILNSDGEKSISGSGTINSCW